MNDYVVHYKRVSAFDDEYERFVRVEAEDMWHAQQYAYDYLIADTGFFWQLIKVHRIWKNLDPRRQAISG
jgi:hypothetical protein